MMTPCFTLRRALVILLILLRGSLSASPPNPPQDQWDQVLSFYTHLGIPEEAIHHWRPWTTGRPVRAGGFFHLPEPPLNPFRGSISILISPPWEWFP